MGDQSPKEKPKRSWKSYVLDPDLQLGYLSIYFVTFAVFIIGFLTLNVIFVYIRYRDFARWGDPEGLSFNDEFVPFVIYNTVLVVFIAVVMAAYSIIHSHRVVGPLYRLRMSLRRLQEGDYNFTVKFREHDFFHDIAEEMNILGNRLVDRNNRIARIVEQLTELRDKMDGAPADDVKVALTRLDNLTEQLADAIGADLVAEPEVPQAEPAPDDEPKSAAAPAPAVGGAGEKPAS